MLTIDSVVQEMLWRGEAERGMLSAAILERLDVDIIEGVSNGFRSSFIGIAMHPLILVAVEEALGRRVVPAAPFGHIDQTMLNSIVNAWKAWLA